MSGVLWYFEWRLCVLGTHKTYVAAICYHGAFGRCMIPFSLVTSKLTKNYLTQIPSKYHYTELCWAYMYIQHLSLQQYMQEANQIQRIRLDKNAIGSKANFVPWYFFIRLLSEGHLWIVKYVYIKMCWDYCDVSISVLYIRYSEFELI